MSSKSKNIYYLALTGLFVALLTVSSKISIPMVPVPFTLQSAVALLAGVCLGGQWSLCCMVVYILLGLLGVPVFATGGGIGYLVSPTFGFILGFVVGAFAASLIANRKNPSPSRLILAVSVGTVLIYVTGILWYVLLQYFYFGKAIDIWKVLWSFWILFIPSDIVKGALVVLVGGRLRKLAEKRGL